MARWLSTNTALAEDLGLFIVRQLTACKSAEGSPMLPSTFHGHWPSLVRLPTYRDTHST